MKVRYFLFVFVVLFAASVFTAASYAKISMDSCVAMWLLDEGKNDIAVDSSGTGNDGTLMNDPEWVDGKFGKALEFDGENQYVDCGNNESLDLIEDFTIVAWINYDDPENDYDYAQVVARTDGGGQGGVEFGVSPGTGKLFTTNGPATVRSNTPLSKNEWHHIACAYTGGTLTFYANGEPDGGGAINFPSSTQRTGIGRTPGRELLPYKGIIDDVAVFVEALTQSDIKSIMNRGLSVALGLTAVSSPGKIANTWGHIKTCN